LGILDHEFVAGGLEWKVYVRVIPNEDSTWTFMRPDRLTDEQFQEQLNLVLNGYRFIYRLDSKSFEVANAAKRVAMKHCRRTIMEESYIIRFSNISSEYDDKNEMDL
jgi:hypothetical protein